MQAKTLSNAIWNVVNGSSSALVAVVVPPFLTRQLEPDAFGAWALALQIAAYVSLFGFGIQMAVGRYVAHCEARKDRAQRDGIVATAFWFLVAAGALAWLVIIGVALSIQRLVPQLDPGLVEQTRWAIVLVGLSLSVGLPASVFAAVFSGLQRSHVPAQIQGGGRILLAVGLIVAGYSRNLAVLGLVYAAISLLTAGALWRVWRDRTPEPSVARRHASRAHGRELASFCFSLTIWNFSMLLVNGLDLVIVGRYDYAATAFFAVAVTLTTLVSGVLASLASALVPASAGLAEGAGGVGLKEFLFRSSRLILAAALLASAPLIFGGETVLSLWVGPEYAARSASLLSLLVIAALLRNTMVAYSTVAIGVGQQRKMFATPIVEGVVSVVLSIFFCQQIGAQGVAYAKIIGAATGVALLMAQHPLRALIEDASRREYSVNSILRPLLALAPVGAAAAVMPLITTPEESLGLLRLGLLGLVTAASVWMIALSGDDRRFAEALVRHKLGSRRSPRPDR